MTRPHHDRKRASAPGVRAAARWAVLWIAGCCVLIELLLQGADLGLFGSPLWRSLAYQNGAFWPGLLHGWQANYSLQPGAMFLTYAFLHGGLGHLAGNMITLWVLGRVSTERVGQKGFLLIYTISALGGAALFGAVAASPQPMVGASGALFGLAGAWQYWDYVDAAGLDRRIRRLVGGVGFLVILNIVFWVLLDGILAWQTHLGGYLVGWVMAMMLQRRVFR